MEKQLFNYVVTFYTEKNRSLTFLSERLFVSSDVDFIFRLEFESRRYARNYEVVLRERGRKDKVVFSYKKISFILLFLIFH